MEKTAAGLETRLILCLSVDYFRIVAYSADLLLTDLDTWSWWVIIWKYKNWTLATFDMIRAKLLCFLQNWPHFIKPLNEAEPSHDGNAYVKITKVLYYNVSTGDHEIVWKKHPIIVKISIWTANMVRDKDVKYSIPSTDRMINAFTKYAKKSWCSFKPVSLMYEKYSSISV